MSALNALNLSRKTDFLLIGLTSFFLTTSLLFSTIYFTESSSKSRRYPTLSRNKRRKWKFKSSGRNRRGRNRNRSERISTEIAIVVYDQDTGKIVTGFCSNRVNGEENWCLPGGWLHKGESFEGCALRHLSYETGLTAASHIEKCLMLPVAPYLTKISKAMDSTNRTKKDIQGAAEKNNEVASTSDATSDSSKKEYIESVTTFVMVLLKRGLKHDLKKDEKNRFKEWKWIDPVKFNVDSDILISGKKVFSSLEYFLKLNYDFEKDISDKEK